MDGISAEEACRKHAYTPEDYKNACNDDGSLKTHSKTTTFTLKNDETKSVTVNNSVIQATAIAIFLIAMTSIVLLTKSKLRKK